VRHTVVLVTFTTRFSMRPTIHRLTLPLLLALALLVPTLGPAHPVAAAFAPPRQLCSCAGLHSVTTVGSTLFFVTNSELWKSDGTAAGTVLVKAFPSYLFPSELTVVGSTLFFTAGASASDSYRKLWKSDGTPAGTIIVKDTDDRHVPGNLTALGGTLFFFSGWDGSFTLWKSDGTAAGTVSIAYFEYVLNNDLREVTAVGNTLFFVTVDSTHGEELWKSDGTASGTALVKDINPGTAGSAPGLFIALGSTLYFTANNGTNGQELWKSDGSAIGTVLVKDLNPGATGSNPGYLTVAGHTLFFGASSGVGGDGLWKSDGSAAGTVLVKPFSVVNQLWKQHGNGPTAVGGTVFFGFDDNNSGQSKLWRSDGSAAGTTLVKTIYPTQLTAVGNTLFFVQYYYQPGLWQSDSTSAGTVPVSSFPPGAQNASMDKLTSTPIGLFFTADDGLTGSTPWLLPITASLDSSNGGSGAPGSAFAFTAAGFPAGAAVTISVTPPAAQGANLAAAAGSYVAGTVTADAGGAVAFAVRLDEETVPGAYTVTASSGNLSASVLVTVSATAPLLSAPDGVSVLGDRLSVFLPMLRR
jgi:ELWxxDGT repeat protein